MNYFFRGSRDKSAVVLYRVFPLSDVVFSVPVGFDGTRSGVYIEGNLDHLEVLYQHLREVRETSFDERCFGRWSDMTPPDGYLGRMIMHYEARSITEKLQLLNFVLRKHLAEVCGLNLMDISDLLVRVAGVDVQHNPVALPADICNGKILLCG